MFGLDAAELLTQWASGMLLVGWVTTRHRLVSRGFGHMIRLIAAVLLAVSALVTTLTDVDMPIAIPAVVLALLAVTGLFGSVRSRQHDIEPDPIWDLLVGGLGLLLFLAFVAATYDPAALAVARAGVGALFLGAIGNSMLLGHWYLLQPGMSRAPLLELVWMILALWPIELLLQLWPTGMLSVISGDINDGSGGLLGWFWIGCVVMTPLLIIATRLALREKQYEAVMAATGLLYLAILTGFGMDLVARALLGSA